MDAVGPALLLLLMGALIWWAADRVDGESRAGDAAWGQPEDEDLP